MTCVPPEGAPLIARGHGGHHGGGGGRGHDRREVVRAAGSYLPQTLRAMEVSDMHRSSPSRTVNLPFNSDMKNGNALIETVVRGDMLYFCT